MNDQNGNDAASADSSPTPSPSASSRSGRRSRVGPAAIAGGVVIAIAAAIGGYLYADRGSTDDTSSSTDASAISAIKTLVEKYNGQDFEYVRENSCGELKVRAETDLGGLMDFQGDGAPSASKYKVEELSDFQYFSQIGTVAQVYSKAKIRYPNAPQSNNHVASFTLLKNSETKNKWNVCSSYLISALPDSQ